MDYSALLRESGVSMTRWKTCSARRREYRVLLVEGVGGRVSARTHGVCYLELLGQDEDRVVPRMSMMGLAARPRTDVDPKCSISKGGAAAYVGDDRACISNFFAQAAS